MKTKGLAFGEFSASPRRALSAVARVGRVLVTSRGKPKAILIPTSEATVMQDLKMLDRFALAQAVAAIRDQSIRQGTDELSIGAIGAGVAAVRSKRKRPGKVG